MKQHSQIRAVIHLSSTAVYTAVGYFDDHHKKTKIMAIGIANTDAFFGGQIINRQHLLSAIHRSVRDAMDMAGLELFDVGLSFANAGMKSFNAVEDAYVMGDGTHHASGQLISNEDIRVTLERAKFALVGKQQSALQLCVQFVSLDGKQLVEDAIGMRANQISIGYHMMGIPTSYYEQMSDLLRSNNLEMYPSLFDGVVSAEYVLTDEEKERGVCFIDIGAGTTSVCLYNKGILLHSQCIDIGGQLVDMDIASELRISLLEAETLKKQHGSAYAQNRPKGEFITLKKRSGGELTVNVYELASIIEARYQELFTRIFQEVIDAGLIDFMEAGVVLAGGATQMNDLPTLIKHTFNVPVRAMTINKQIEVCAKHLSDDNIKLLRNHLKDAKLHSVIGALMYQFSERYRQDERHLYGETQATGFFGRFLQQLQYWFDKLRAML
ncbi:cell division protein FtsA [Moraxella oblonga]|uniref:cell division protein FtsA n=1 Tax=Moraxella oblonga TaxID=200413 RepID=UPI0008310824|nr:cell division protein FtsA [Moraxella oblonga]